MYSADCWHSKHSQAPQDVLMHSGSAPPITAVLPVAPTNSAGVSSRRVLPSLSLQAVGMEFGVNLEGSNSRSFVVLFFFILLRRQRRQLFAVCRLPVLCGRKKFPGWAMM